MASVWQSLSKFAKEQICHDIWGIIIAELRQIPRPKTSNNPFAYYSTVDDSPIHHPMLGDYNDICPVLEDDKAFRDRIFERYVEHNGLSYADGKELPHMLLPSDSSVFTHGDIHPANILVNKQGQIVGLLDWESAGFYPD